MELPPAPIGLDPLLQMMQKHGMPLTRANYLALNFPDGVPDPIPYELEAEIPQGLI